MSGLEDSSDTSSSSDYYYFYDLNTTFPSAENVDSIFIYTANISYGVRTFMPPIIIVLSLVGNVFCIKTFFLLGMGPYPSAVFLLIQSVLEIGFVWLYCGNDIYENVNALDLVAHLKNSSDLHCKLLSFLVSCGVSLYHWLMVVIIAEMAYVKGDANRIHSLTHTYVKDILACLITIFVCINVHYFWTFGIVTVEEDLRGFGHLIQNFCMFTIASLSGQNHMPNYVFGKAWFFCDMLISALIPLVIVSVLMGVYYRIVRRQGGSIGGRRELCALGSLGTSGIVNHMTKEDMRCLLHMKPKVIFDFIENVYPTIGLAFLVCNMPHQLLLTVDYLYENPQPSPILTVISAICEQLHNSFYAIKAIIFIIKSIEVNRVTIDALKYCYQCLKSLKQMCQKKRSSDYGIHYEQVANRQMRFI